MSPLINNKKIIRPQGGKSLIRIRSLKILYFNIPYRLRILAFSNEHYVVSYWLT